MATIFILLVIYVLILIRLEPSLKSKKSTEVNLNSEIQQQSQKKNPGKNSIQPTTLVETKEIVEELPRTLEPLEKPKAQFQTLKEPTPPPPKEVSKTKELITHEAKKIPKKGGPPGCSYYFGYLGQLPKNTPIPDECLGCLKIMECLIKRSTNSTT